MIDPGTPFSRPLQTLIDSLQTNLLLGVEQPGTLDLLYRRTTTNYPIKGPGPVSGLAAQATGFVAGRPAVFNLGQHYTYAVGQLVWQPADPDPALAASWFPDDNSRLTVGYFYRDLPSGITDFNAGSVAGTLVRAVARELGLLYGQMDEAYRRAFIDHAQGAALDNVVALIGVVRKAALPAQGAVTFSLKKAPRNDVPIPVGTRVADARGRIFKVTAPGLIPALVEDSVPAGGTVLHASQVIAKLVQVQPKGSSTKLATVDTAPGKPYGNDGMTVTLAAAPPAGATLVLGYQAKTPQVTVPVVAQDTGPEGNLGSRSLTVMPTPPRGVDGGVTNADPLAGGEAAETDDALRDRAKHALELAGNATLNAIRYAVLNIDGIDSVEVRDFSVDPAIPTGEVWVRYATGKSGLQDKVSTTVDQTRAAGIKARVTQVATVMLTGTVWVIPDVAGAGKAAFAQYQRAVVDALNALGIGESVSPRKLASKVFQIAGLADVGEVQLDYQRGSAAAQPLLDDPFVVGDGEQAKPDANAITVQPLQAIAVAAGATLDKTSGALSCQLRLRDDSGAAVALRHLVFAVTAAVRGKPSSAPNQPLQQVVLMLGSVTFTGSAPTAASFTPLDAAGRASLAALDVATLELQVQAAAYAGILPGTTALGLTG